MSNRDAEVRKQAEAIRKFVISLEGDYAAEALLHCFAHMVSTMSDDFIEEAVTTAVRQSREAKAQAMS